MMSSISIPCPADPATAPAQAIFEARLHVCTVPPRKKPRFEKIEQLELTLVDSR